MSKQEQGNDEGIDLDRAMKVAGLAFAGFTVVRTLVAARRDDDGLQLGEAVLRGATLAFSLAIFVRELRSGDQESLEV